MSGKVNIDIEKVKVEPKDILTFRDLYEEMKEEICPICGGYTHKLDWAYQAELHREWIASGKATLQGWWSIQFSDILLHSGVLMINDGTHNVPNNKIALFIDDLAYDFKYEDFALSEYVAHPHIKGEVSV